MDKLIFGLVWELFVGVFFLICIFAGVLDLFVILFFLLFLLAGGFVLYLGIKDILKDRKTSANGEICYGIITNIDSDSSSVQVNGQSQYKATVDFYVSSMNCMKSLSESVGYKFGKYSIGSCVKIKFYNDDINIIENNIDINTLPYNIQDYLKGVKQNNAVPDGLYTGEENVIIINGVRYIRDDNNQSTM